LGQQNKQNKNTHKLNMKLTKIVAISSLAALAITPVFAGAKSFKETVVVQEEAKPAWNASLSTGWDSVYMFRGVNVLRTYSASDDQNSISWVAGNIGYNLTDSDSISIGAWMGTGLADTNSYRELDIPINYVHTIGDLSLGLGYQLYSIWDSSATQTQTYAHELSASAAYNIKVGSATLTPSVTYFYNLGPDNDGASNNGAMDATTSYLSLRLDGSIPVLSNVSLNPYVGYGANFSQNTKNADLNQFNGGNNVEYGLAVPVKINDTITVSGYVAQSIALENLNNSTRQCTTWGGAKVTFSF
jgi:hypothetical protein